MRPLSFIPVCAAQGRVITICRRVVLPVELIDFLRSSASPEVPEGDEIVRTAMDSLKRQMHGSSSSQQQHRMVRNNLKDPDIRIAHCADSARCHDLDRLVRRELDELDKRVAWNTGIVARSAGDLVNVAALLLGERRTRQGVRWLACRGAQAKRGGDEEYKKALHLELARQAQRVAVAANFLTIASNSLRSPSFRFEE